MILRLVCNLGKWRLAADLSRFLKAIGDGDQCSPRHPTLLNANIYPVVAPTVKQPISKGGPRDKYGQVRLKQSHISHFNTFVKVVSYFIVRKSRNLT